MSDLYVISKTQAFKCSARLQTRVTGVKFKLVKQLHEAEGDDCLTALI